MLTKSYLIKLKRKNANKDNIVDQIPLIKIKVTVYPAVARSTTYSNALEGLNRTTHMVAYTVIIIIIININFPKIL